MLRCVAMAALLVLGGCASAWERSYESRVGVPRQALPARAEVTVREAPWSRVEEALRELSAMWEQSDVPYEEWPTEKKREADARLLRALQVTDSVDEVQIVGRSSFKTVERVRPHAGALEKFARSIGADTAIWASRYVGKSERVESQPVYSSGYRHVQYYDTRSKKYRTRLEYNDWTTYVPVVVEADETAWVVYYLRHQ